jgi:hypothetical protein
MFDASPDRLQLRRANAAYGGMAQKRKSVLFSAVNTKRNVYRADKNR